MIFAKQFARIFYCINCLCIGWRSNLLKKRSIDHMTQLEDHLLDDIGFTRDTQGNIVPNTRQRLAECNQLAAEQRGKAHARYVYFIRCSRHQLR